MKRELGGRHFASDDDVINAVEYFLSDKDSGFYAEGIRMLHDRWTKCVSVEGDYVENKCVYSLIIDSFYLGARTYQSPLVYT